MSPSGRMPLPRTCLSASSLSRRLLCLWCLSCGSPTPRELWVLCPGTVTSCLHQPSPWRPLRLAGCCRPLMDVSHGMCRNLSTPGAATLAPMVRPEFRLKGGDNPYSNPKVCPRDTQRSRGHHARRPRQRRLAQPSRRRGHADLDSPLAYNLQLLAHPGRRPSQADLDSTLEYNLQLLLQDPALQQLLEGDLPPVAVAGRWVTSPLLLQQLRHAPWRTPTRFQ